MSNSDDNSKRPLTQAVTDPQHFQDMLESIKQRLEVIADHNQKISNEVEILKKSIELYQVWNIISRNGNK